MQVTRRKYGPDRAMGRTRRPRDLSHPGLYVIEVCEPRMLLTVITVTSLADTFANDGQVTLREALQAANTDAPFNEVPAGSGADTIQFDPALFSAGSRTLALGGVELPVTDSLTLVGPGSTLLTLDAGDSSRLFNIARSSGAGAINVSLSGMSMIRGYVGAGPGGGIYCTEALTLTDCIVSNCNSRDTVYNDGFYHGGGGLDFLGPSLHLAGCTFSNCISGFLPGGGAGPGGGVLCASSANILIEDTTFDGNKSWNDGGGLAVMNTGNFTVTIRRSTFVNNRAEFDGGGYYSRQTPTMNFSDTLFDSNSSKFEGGGAYASGTLTANRCRFTNNRADTYAGGGLETVRAIASINDCVFSGNTTTGQFPGGGGLRIGEMGARITRCIITDNVVDSDNSLSNRGGAGIYADGPLTLIDTTVARNHASLAAGGGIFVTAALTLTNCTIAGNTTTREGGGINFAGTSAGSCTITHGTIAANSADKGGGFFAPSGTLTLQSCLIADNAAVTQNTDMSGQANGDYNFIENPAGAFLIGSNNTAGQDPLLAGLGNFGGPVPTMPLRTGSPALDRAVANGIALDTRGHARPLDDLAIANAPGGDGSDPGSVEGAETPRIVGRYLFYDNSSFDGNTPGVTAADDLAIAPDKTALLPGQTATFSNFSNYSRGLNGVMFDILGLPASGALTVADLNLRISNDPAGANWTANAPTPTAFSIRKGAGANGSDRVEIVFADGAIRSQWLRVTVPAGAKTGLASADVFYFGNAPADSTGDGIVDSTDYYSVRDHLRSYDNPTPIDWKWDLNRDGVTDITDLMLTRSSATNASTALRMISTPAGVIAPVTKQPTVATSVLGSIASTQSPPTKPSPSTTSRTSIRRPLLVARNWLSR